jgi:hypothetical protein
MFKIEMDVSGLQRKLAKLGHKELARAAVYAVNDATKRLQIELQHDVRQQFTVRNEFVIRQAAVISPFASVSQGRPFAEIGVGIGKVKPQRLFLAQYEQGGPRAAVAGSPLAAAPVVGGPARPSKRSKVPAQFRYKALALRKVKGTRKGRKKTFVIPNVGVFQRVGSGKRDIRAVYTFERDQQLPDLMRFREVTQRFAPRFLREEMERQIARAIARANR